MEAAYEAHRARRLEEAEGLYRAVLADAPEHGAALHHLGLIRHQQGASEEGLALIDRAIALEPGDLQSRFNRITVLRGLGREEEIAEVYREAAGFHFVSMPANWDGGEPHPAPRRQFIIPLSGEMVFQVSDGEKRVFGAGDVLLVEDTEGKGHVSHMVSTSLGVVAVVPLPESD